MLRCTLIRFAYGKEIWTSISTKQITYGVTFYYHQNKLLSWIKFSHCVHAQHYSTLSFSFVVTSTHIEIENQNRYTATRIYKTVCLVVTLIEWLLLLSLSSSLSILCAHTVFKLGFISKSALIKWSAVWNGENLNSYIKIMIPTLRLNACVPVYRSLAYA